MSIFFCFFFKWVCFLQVQNLSAMFFGATSFNSDVSEWKTHNCVNMSSMFCGATLFNSSLGRWVTAQVQDMSLMFDDCRAFTGDGLKLWEVSAETDKTSMFNNTLVAPETIPWYNNDLPAHDNV